MDGQAVSDYATAYSDVFQSPDNYDSGGIYTMDRAKQEDDPWSQPVYQDRYSSDLLMRGDPRGRGGHRGGHRGGRGRTEGFSQRAYAEGEPMRYPGRSQRYGRPALDDAMWDERPRSFRPNSSNQYAQLFVPPQLHDSRYLAWPVYSPSHAVSVINREPFAAQSCDAVPVAAPAGGSRRESNAITAKTLEVGLQMVKVVLFLVIIILLAMWLVMSSLGAKRDVDLKRIIEEAIAASKTK